MNGNALFLVHYDGLSAIYDEYVPSHKIMTMNEHQSTESVEEIEDRIQCIRSQTDKRSMHILMDSDHGKEEQDDDVEDPSMQPLIDCDDECDGKEGDDGNGRQRVIEESDYDDANHNVTDNRMASMEGESDDVDDDEPINTNNKRARNTDSDYDPDDDFPSESQSESMSNEPQSGSDMEISNDSQSESDDDSSENELIIRSPKNKNNTKRRKSRFTKFECKDCDESFVSPSEFKRHSLKMHGNKRPFCCDQCDKTYVDAKGLEYHVRNIHDKEINHRCRKCKKPFFDANFGRKHEEKCKKTSYYLVLCPERGCDEAFEAHIQWRRHMNIVHNISKPYQCTLCLPKNVRYSGRAGLKQHIENVHEKRRDYQCRLCPKSFFKKEYLERHQRVHDGKKPFICLHCNQGFTQKESRRQHIKNVHLGIKRFECDCGKKFANRKGLRSHAAAIHGNAGAARFGWLSMK